MLLIFNWQYCFGTSVKTGFLGTCAHLQCQDSFAGGILGLLLLIPVRLKGRRRTWNKKQCGKSVLDLGKGYSYWKLTSVHLSILSSTSLSPGQRCAQRISQLCFFALAVSVQQVLLVLGHCGVAGGGITPGPVRTCSPTDCRNELQICCLAPGLNTFIFPCKYN